MSDNTCRKCGTDMEWVGRSGYCQSGYCCTLNPKDCRIRELERQLSAEQTAHAETRKALEEADEALIEAVEHLEYCGYGDSWERECARDSGMFKRMDAAGAAALTRQAQRKGTEGGA